VVRGLRYPVQSLLELLASGMTVEDVFADYPDLEREDLLAALARWRDPMALNLYGRANTLTRADFVEAGERLGLRARAITRMIDAIVGAAQDWPDKCGAIGFDDRQTKLLAQTLRTRIGSLRQRSPCQWSSLTAASEPGRPLRRAVHGCRRR
jgi:serine/threonine-protein kinase HipA